jgi:hypothetical protein
MKPGDGTIVDTGLAQKERAELQKVVLHSFNANPLAVKTFGATALSWNVTLPTDSPFDMSVLLNGKDVAPIGNQTVNLLQTTVFTLSAATEHAGRQLRTLTVRVDASDCRAHTIDPFLITQPLKTEFDTRFGGSSKFSLRGNGTTVTLGDGTINIDVPLTINVPDWFDADMNINIQLAVSGGSRVLVTAPVVSADVSWSFFENLLSLGCGDLVQSGMTQMAQAFLSDIVNSELVPKVTQAITDQVNGFITSLQTADPQHRTYVMTLLVLSGGGLTFTACPK